MRLGAKQVSKAVRLLSLLPTRPVEFFDRLVTVVDVAIERGRTKRLPCDTIGLIDALSQALQVSHSDIGAILAESEIGHIQQEVMHNMLQSKHTQPFDPSHNGDFNLGRSIYVACRVLSPNIVLETGVAHGVTSAFILQALSANRKGRLFSIDLPPLERNADQNVGLLIPSALKNRWSLHRGAARRILPDLVREIGDVDVFVHDSLHTRRQMEFEFATIWSSLRPPAVLIADDVGLNDAFHDFVSTMKPTFSAVVKEESKDALFGILVKRT